MKHHFGDWLDREDGHWKMVPNRERFAHALGKPRKDDSAMRVALIGKDTRSWERVLELPQLEELTLHEGTTEQFEAVCGLERLKRLRVSHLRPRSIAPISRLAQLEELVLEYVPGFSDLSPLSSLPRLRSLHLENLRRVRDFSGLAGCNSLRLLDIYGTLDWNQPIDDFEFLRGLPQLEVLELAFVTSPRPYPAFLPAASLSRLRKIRIPPHYFEAREYALLSTLLAGVDGADWGAWRRMSYFAGKASEEWFEFIGKRAGRVKCSSVDSAAKCADAERRFEAMKASARAEVGASRGRPVPG
jgi:hypothetical protein